jgi:hypothetical protein
MPRHWEPLPHEVNFFQEIYIDESSQNDHHFLVLGGIMLPRFLSAQFETDIIEARHPRLVSRNSEGKLREIGWKYVSTGYFEAYKQVVDAYFSFGYRRLQRSGNPMAFYASVVDLTVPGRRYTGGKRGEVGFDREIYYHCLSIARRCKTNLFHVYPDYRSTSRPIRELGTILCYGIRKEPGERREWAFRRVQFASRLKFRCCRFQTF